jgi:hypothetical protein
MSKIEMQPVMRAKFKRATLEATVIRADGTVEHLGVIADSRPFLRQRKFFARLFARLFGKES